MELVDGERHMPTIPLPYTSIALDGTWTSNYRLNVSHNDLSASGLGDFNYDRTSAHAALLLWQKTARRLLQYMLDSLSPVSIVMLDLCVGIGGYADLKSKYDTLGLWQLIKTTHLVVSVRAKQQSLLDLLAWKQSDASFPEDLSTFRTLMDSFLTNYESPPSSGNISAEVIFHQIFLSGIRPALFQREIDNAYDQHADKITS